MGWINLILILIKYGPVVYRLIKEIINLIKQLRDSRNKSDRLYAVQGDDRLAAEYNRYKRTRDKSKLEKLRNDLRNQCARPGG